MEKLKNIVLISVFSLLLLSLSIFEMAKPDTNVSVAERRNLQQKPVLSKNSVFDKKFMNDLDSYLLDQFPFRDGFRSIKAYKNLYVLGKKDNNNIFVVDNCIYKTEYPLNIDQVTFAANKMNDMRKKLPPACNFYYSIIPDKNYFVAKQTGHLALDYDKLVSQVNTTVQNMKYIDIFNLLAKDDYYRTDTHWRQERIYPVAQKLANEMGVTLLPFSDFEIHSLDNFHGVYLGQSALNIQPENIIYMTNNDINASRVTSQEVAGDLPVYAIDKFLGMDGYDIFLSGAQAIETIVSSNKTSNRELVIFRDSFGSSISPILIGAYSKITLVDLRYVVSDFVTQFVQFTNQDVLFLYSTSLLNSGMLLK